MQYEWPVPSEEQDQIPYAAALLEQAPLQTVRDQAPGHMGRLPEEFAVILNGAEWLDMSVVKGVDVAAVPGTTTPLQQADALWAKLYRAKVCRVLTTGATHAAKAAVKALVETVGPDGHIAFTANCHISVVDASKDARVRGVVMPPNVSPLGCATVLDPADLERVLKKHPKIRGVVISTPSYEGAVSKMQRLVDICHRHGAVVMIDSSWGSELDLSSDLPVGAVEAGADVVVLSPHKSMWALGQTACVVLPHGSRISELTFGAAVREAGSTSKSSLMLAIADIGRRYAAFHASELISRSIAVVREEEARLGDLELGHLIPSWDGVDRIPYREVFDVRETGYTGYELEPMLRAKHIQVAQANIGFLCCGFGVGADDSIRATFRGLEEVVRELEPRPRLANIPLPPFRLREIDFRVVPGSQVEVVPFREAIGRLAKLPLGAYPPGACILLPGAPILEEDVSYLEEVSERGGTLFGHPAEVPAGHVAVIRE